MRPAASPRLRAVGKFDGGRLAVLQLLEAAAGIRRIRDGLDPEVAVELASVRLLMDEGNIQNAAPTGGRQIDERRMQNMLADDFVVERGFRSFRIELARLRGLILLHMRRILIGRQAPDRRENGGALHSAPVADGEDAVAMWD